jgi:ATP-dependent Clp protease protease subunit
MDQILSTHTGQPTEKIRVDTDRSMTLSAADAVAYGLADRVIASRPARSFRLAQAN